MGWVTLTLRKTELKRTHADYQNELLTISRTKRQMARENAFEQAQTRSQMQAELRGASDAYNEQKDGTDDRNQLDEFRLRYQEITNEIREQYEAELAILEQEANDEETDMDQQQVQVEAQLESISAEIEAVGQAISQQVQASTIKLS